ncbi:MAG: class I SAM-dependent RNA methyltransferase [Bryobacteraceae bacterium]
MNATETNQPAAPPPQNFEITIDKLIYGGQGLGRLDGRVVFVPFVLPGERLTVEVQVERPGLLEAMPRDFIERSAERIEPGCPYFYRCGGCQYQHASYAAQLAAKSGILADVLRRVGKIEPPCEIRTISGEPWGYRNRAQFHIENGAIGYFGYGSHALAAVERCPISSPRVNEALAALRAMLDDRRFPDFLRSVEVFTNETEVQLNVLESIHPVARRFFDWCAESIPGFTPDAIEYRTGADLYRVRHRSFFQVNRFLIDAMIGQAAEAAEGESALDLYAGVGLFTLPLARRFAKMTAVESNRTAAEDLEFNAGRAGLAVTVDRNPVEAALAALERAPDFVLADPPRAGLGKAAVRELLRLKPRLLTLVSCDPATLARDLNALLAGGYRIEALSLIDLFPQTFHLETVARLRAD